MTPLKASDDLSTMLQRVPLFAALKRDEIDAVRTHVMTRSYAKNSVLITEGDETDSLYVILSGRVKVYLSDDRGKEVILTQQVSGEYFGELALIDDAERSASVMTLEPSTFAIITKQAFKEILAANPTIAITLIKDLTYRIRTLTDNVKSLALMDVYGRVAKTLLSMAQQSGDKLLIDEKLTQQDIADRVGSSREMVSKILKDLTSGGYISVDHKRIVINERLPMRY